MEDFPFPMLMSGEVSLDPSLLIQFQSFVDRMQGNLKAFKIIARFKSDINILQQTNLRLKAVFEMVNVFSETEKEKWGSYCRELEDYGGAPTLDKESYEAAAKDAEAKGFEVVTREPDQLLLDLDDEYAYSRYQYILERMQFGWEHNAWASKDGGRHVVVQLPLELDPLEALLLQACLGSDPMHEFLNYLRLKMGVQEPSRLFKPGPAKIIDDVTQTPDLEGLV